MPSLAGTIVCGSCGSVDAEQKAINTESRSSRKPVKQRQNRPHKSTEWRAIAKARTTSAASSRRYRGRDRYLGRVNLLLQWLEWLRWVARSRDCSRAVAFAPASPHRLKRRLLCGHASQVESIAWLRSCSGAAFRASLRPAKRSKSLVASVRSDIFSSPAGAPSCARRVVDEWSEKDRENTPSGSLAPGQRKRWSRGSRPVVTTKSCHRLLVPFLLLGSGG
jgi:uncharacterized Zn finger protein (UPF0148 family)